MNENLIYIVIVIAVFIAYRKYKQYQILKLVPSLLDEGGVIVDVRSVEEFGVANRKGSVNIPLISLKNRLGELDDSKPTLLCCASGSRSALAKRILSSNGFENVYNVGTWRALAK